MNLLDAARLLCFSACLSISLLVCYLLLLFCCCCCCWLLLETDCICCVNGKMSCLLGTSFWFYGKRMQLSVFLGQGKGFSFKAFWLVGKWLLYRILDVFCCNFVRLWVCEKGRSFLVFFLFCLWAGKMMDFFWVVQALFLEL